MNTSLYTLRSQIFQQQKSRSANEDTGGSTDPRESAVYPQEVKARTTEGMWGKKTSLCGKHTQCH